MAEIEGTDDFQQMLTKLKQRVNNIAAVKATVAAQDPGGDVREQLDSLTGMLKKGFTALLDDKAGELEMLGSIAAEATAGKKAGDTTSAELKKEITSTLNALLSDFNSRLDGSLKDNIRNVSMSVKDEIAAVKSSIPSIDVNAIGNKLNTIGSAVETLTNTMKQTVEQMKSASSSAAAAATIDENAVKSLINDIKLTVGDSINTRLETALAPLRGEISSLKAVITTLKMEPASSGGVDFTKSYIETIQSEFSGEIKEIRALVEKENNMVKSQTLEFLSYITDKIIDLHGKIDSVLRPEDAVAASQPGRVVSPTISSRINEEIGNGVQREIAPVMDGLVHIIRFLVALSKR
ncbi:MAG: hypothetical protein HQK99_07945 [Nitrospirae bacterium]|nr:hypothetical protein [Nitrospirota bacterium]